MVTYSNESMLYDFDVQPGSEVTFYTLMQSQALVVEAVTSTSINGVLRKVITFQDGSYNE
ncbi:MAG: hypothetical protein SH856_01860 [Flavobacteriales bacterium]|nr:hypothetical protein [Flavobacteriales bacterium]